MTGGLTFEGRQELHQQVSAAREAALAARACLQCGKPVPRSARRRYCDRVCERRLWLTREKADQ